MSDSKAPKNHKGHRSSANRGYYTAYAHKLLIRKIKRAKKREEHIGQTPTSLAQARQQRRSANRRGENPTKGHPLMLAA